MTPRIRRQRGEGKVGCVVSLIILLFALAIAIKAVPVYWSNIQLKDAAKDLASRASIVNLVNIEKQLRAKAMELEIPQAAVQGAITVKQTGDGLQGTCSVTIKYTQKIDFYGVAEYTVETDETVSAPYMNVN